MLTNAWTSLRHHALQSRMWRTKSRFVVAACGRGSGKTELARRRIVRFLPIKKAWSNPLYFYALPTYSQAKRVAWEPLLELIPKDWLAEVPNKSEMRIKTKFGSTLYVVGLDKPQRIEGVQWDGCVIDESSDQRPKVFDTSVLPALSHRQGWCWRIGVPKRYGNGAKEFKEAFRNPGQDTSCFQWPSSDILSPEEILLAQSKLGEIDYREQYLATFEDISGLIFYAFDQDYNVSSEVEYDCNLPIVVGSDFNVDPMSWVIGHRGARDLSIFDEISLRNTNTPRTLDFLFKKYGAHEAGFEFYGDASGKARKTSADFTDYVHIKNDKRFHAARVYYPKSNPRRSVRFAECNALFCTTTGERRTYINPRCKKLLADLDTRVYKEGTSDPDDYGDVGHLTDALGYIIHKRFPIYFTQSGISQVGVHVN